MRLAVLPGSFPKGTEFFDVGGVPVSLIEGIASAWDDGKGRWFLFNSRAATRLSEARFRAMVAACEPRDPNDLSMHSEQS